MGTGYIVALFGNVWMLVNPWKITFELFEGMVGRQRGERESPMFAYPKKWDVWPALALFLIFAWLENVYTGSAIPLQLGVLIVFYSLLTWTGMLLFGKHTWLRHGEAFSVLFRFFSRFSPTEVRVSDTRLCRRCSQSCNPAGELCVDCYDCFERALKDQREFNIRPYAVGLALPDRVTTATAAFIVFALATVTFDGLQETPAWQGLQMALYSTASALGPNVTGTIDTLGVTLLPFVFLGVYLIFIWGTRQLSREAAPVTDVAKGFVFSLVPIALAYNLAHFLALFLIQGQLMIPLASDPYGFNWDLFGSADYRVNVGVINARVAWFISLTVIVLGHIISVYIAHVISLRRVPHHGLALRGQYPLLALMVFYTATSLWIIAQPIVES